MTQSILYSSSRLESSYSRDSARFHLLSFISGSSSYHTGGSNKPSSNKYFPKSTFLTFDTGKQEAILGKVQSVRPDTILRRQLQWSAQFNRVFFILDVRYRRCVAYCWLFYKIFIHFFQTLWEPPSWHLPTENRIDYSSSHILWRPWRLWAVYDSKTFLSPGDNFCFQNVCCWNTS